MTTTTNSEMTLEMTRAPRMNSVLLTARVPSSVAAPAAWSLTATNYELALEVSGAHLDCFFGREQQEHLALVERRVVLVEGVDRVRQLRVADVVPAAPRDPGVVQPDARAVVADDQDEMRHRVAVLLVMRAVAGVARVAEGVRAHLGDERPAGRQLLRDHLGVVGHEAVRVAEMRLGQLAHHRDVQVRLRLPPVDLVDRR